MTINEFALPILAAKPDTLCNSKRLCAAPICTVDDMLGHIARPAVPRTRSGRLLLLQLQIYKDLNRCDKHMYRITVERGQNRCANILSTLTQLHGYSFVMRIAGLQLTPILTLHVVTYRWEKLLRPQVARVVALRAQTREHEVLLHHAQIGNDSSRLELSL